MQHISYQVNLLMYKLQRKMIDDNDGDGHYSTYIYIYMISNDDGNFQYWQGICRWYEATRI